MRYEVGDYVRIKSNLDGKEFDYVTDTMRKFCGKLGRIIKVENETLDDNNINYNLSFDDDNIWIEDYVWGINAFEYRLGNYDDNKPNTMPYRVGYKMHKDGKLYTFDGHMNNFAPYGKSVFIDENGATLVLPWDMIEYILPLDA